MRRGRPRYDDILTPREWEVLALIEQGLTNEEIAERLGISFGTAKYHVGEIISKLGVETREQAVEAARRRGAPALPFWNLGWLRGRWTWPGLGAAAVAAVLLLIAVVTLTDLLRDPSATSDEGELTDAIADFPEGDAESQAELMTRAPARLSSFYYELVVTSREPMVPENVPRNTNMRTEVWHKAPDQWRVHYHGGASGELRNVHITDGETEWHYNARESTYYEQPAEMDSPRGLVPRPILGPHYAENLEDLMEVESDGPAHYWDVESGEEVAGVTALRLVQSCCRQGSLDQRMSEQTWWVDPTYLFILRIEEKSLGTGGEVLYNVTDVEYNPDLDAELFTFEPPEGATEVPPP